MKDAPVGLVLEASDDGHEDASPARCATQPGLAGWRLVSR